MILWRNRPGYHSGTEDLGSVEEGEDLEARMTTEADDLYGPGQWYAEEDNEGYPEHISVRDPEDYLYVTD